MDVENVKQMILAAGMFAGLMAGADPTADYATRDVFTQGEFFVEKLKDHPAIAACDYGNGCDCQGRLGRVWRGKVSADAIELAANEAAVFDVVW